jgi:hypothetical protein
MVSLMQDDAGAEPDVVLHVRNRVGKLHAHIVSLRQA